MREGRRKREKEIKSKEEGKGMDYEKVKTGKRI